MNELENVIEEMDFIFFATAQHKIEPDAFLKSKEAVFLDVRASEETQTVKFHLKLHIPVLEIPLNEIPKRINEIPKDKLIGIFCSSGVRCVIAFAYLKAKGFKQVKILEGGYSNLMTNLLPGKIYKHINS
ncbi:rhodanese-like domain-containing protein [Perlabentimonas gracilis]|uniref:rhodanese-like domain-containing protein n=1 Tax=Perlabentimonas gracilis TaxID=2715279 RepID=UPI0014081CAA|nr:rhodanese-like domain-containing protein [Perlabentimonas gracilis]NHB69409.1 rhodanese-like domain-containing protein [Perlabentimonas gracilis]